MELIASFLPILLEFRCVFTQPSFAVFVTLLSAWALSHCHRFVTELILTSDNAGNGNHCRFHRFFSLASWSLDFLGCVLAMLLVDTFCPEGSVVLAVDDTLCRKRGLTIHGTGMHHDPLISSRAMKLVTWGRDWVVLCLIVRAPSWSPTKVWALPVAFRLYRNRQGLTKGPKDKKGKKIPVPKPTGHRIRPELAVKLISLVSSWFSNRQLPVTGDSAYGGKSVLSHLPTNVELIRHVHPKGRCTHRRRPDSLATKGRAAKKASVCPRWPSGPTMPRFLGQR